jgi:pyruvate/2-oxoglutarate/acetoin dehydrogenase E1 component
MGELSEKTEYLRSGTDVSLVVLGSDMRELLKKCDTTNTKLDTDIGNLKTENHGDESES